VPLNILQTSRKTAPQSFCDLLFHFSAVKCKAEAGKVANLGRSEDDSEKALHGKGVRNIRYSFPDW
jgi:hypothetical protein